MRGGHAARSGSRRNVDRRPARPFALRRRPKWTYYSAVSLRDTRTTLRRVESFHETMLDEFYRISFRKKLCAEIDELQADLDQWVSSYNQERPYQGQSCLGGFRSCTIRSPPAPVPTQSGSLFPAAGHSNPYSRALDLP